MKKIILFIAAILITPCIGYLSCKSGETPETAVKTADPVTERITASGRITGFKENNNTHAWLGIPFAKPPVGELRWKAPCRTEKWEGTRKALKAGPACTQIGGMLGGVKKDKWGRPIGTENCLFLNVYAPAFTPDNIPKGEKRLPVMLWIHGGGNSIGHAGSYNGKVLAEKYKLIIVTTNYRLGPLGWFAHPALGGKGTTPEDRSGNYGTLDIIHALKWVKRNISNFGGNPGNVTVFGESAGARNTLHMLLSPKARGLFHKAIVQSGSPRTTTMAKAVNYRDAGKPGHAFSSREIINRLLIADKSTPNRKAAIAHQEKMSNKEIADYLRGKNNYDILNAYKTMGGGAGMISFPNVFRDGAVMPYGRSLDILSSKAKYNAVPVILGTNRDEYKLFMAQDPEYINSYFGIIFRFKDRELYDLVSRYRSDNWKAFGVDEVAAVMRNSQGANVYAYRFDWDEEPSLLGTDLGALLGAAHGLEIPFVFNRFSSAMVADLIYNDDNYKGRMALSNSMSSYWAEFARSGSPGRGRNGKETEWKAWDNSSHESGKLIIFDTPEGGGIRMSSETVSRSGLKKRLLAETGLKSQERHCEMYVKLFGDTDLWDDEEYENLGKKGCRNFPQEKYK